LEDNKEKTYRETPPSLRYGAASVKGHENEANFSLFLF
jgi:hypothetical protein